MAEAVFASATLNTHKARILRQRQAAVADAMAQEGLDALVIAGRGVISQYGYLEYVTGWCPIIRLGYAVLVPGGEPVMVMPTASDAVYAREATGLADVRVGGQGDVVADHDGAPETVAAVLAERGVARGRVGVVGLQHIIPALDFDALRAAAPDVEFVDATALVSEIKAVKTDDEIREVLRTGEIADAGMRVVMDRARAGVSGWELWGAVQQEIRRRGAREALIFFGTGAYFNEPPRMTELADGDLVTAYVELTGPNGYWVEKASLLAVGEIGDRRRQTAETCLAALAAGEQALVADRPAGEVAVAIEEATASDELGYGIWHGHGVGVDHDIPVITASHKTVLRPGMVVALHPNIASAGGEIGASAADTFVVTGDRPLRVSCTVQRLFHIPGGRA